MDCIFCKIAKREIKSELIHETDELFVIRDIDPQAPTHLLIIPKKHYRGLTECKETDLLGTMLLTAATLAEKEGIAESGFRTVVNTNEDGGQTVFHLHMHVLGGKPQTGRMG